MERALLLLLVLPFGCADEATTPPAPTVNLSACSTDEDCSSTEICEADVCVEGDRDNGLDEATPLLFDDVVSGEINPAGDVDWYAFETIIDGQWVEVSTPFEGHESSPASTAIRILASNGQLIAEGDAFDIYNITRSDASVVAYLPTAGTYYITVEDIDTWSDLGQKRGGPDYTYGLELTGFGAVLGLGDLDFELTSGTSIFRRGVLLTEANDAASVTFTLGADLSGRPVQVTGMNGLESSDLNLGVQMRQDKDVFAEQVSLGGERMILRPNTEDGSYTLDLYDSNDGIGTNRWGVFYVRSYDADDALTFFGTTPYESEQEPNTIDAQALTLTSGTTESGLSFDGYYVEGVLDAADDSDVFAFDVPPSGKEAERITVRCYGDRFGSRADLNAEVLLPGGGSFTLIEDGEAGTSPTAYNLPTSEAGTYTLALTDVLGTGDASAFYRCQIFVTDWDVAQN
ncbi:MAG: hypothetical protein ACON5B_14935 [Myxococcota bacterium]